MYVLSNLIYLLLALYICHIFYVILINIFDLHIPLVKFVYCLIQFYILSSFLLNNLNNHLYLVKLFFDLLIFDLLLHFCLNIFHSLLKLFHLKFLISNNHYNNIYYLFRQIVTIYLNIILNLNKKNSPM